MDAGHLLADRYELTSHIARGGMADVWEARDRALNRRVAVKVLHAQFSNDESFVRRFRREAQAAANLSHPNIVSVYDWGQDGSTYFIVMELVEGRSLRDILKSEGALLPRRASEIAAEVAAALAVAHHAGLVHRDVKPGNILIPADGTVKVTDFGIARAWDDSLELTRTGAVIGTATYFSPEQAQGQNADARSDLYALGVVLYEMLTATVPFRGESPVAVAYQHVSAPVTPPRQVNPEVPENLDAVVMKALQKSPDARYQDADSFRADLLAAMAGEQPIAAAVAGAAAGATIADDATRVLDGAIAAPPTAPPGEAYREVEDESGSQLPFIITAFVMLAVLVFGVWLVFSLLGNGDEDATPPTLEVPIVAGQTQAEATSILTELGFVVQPEQVADPDVEAGFVIGTDPPAGELAEEGSTIRLQVSAGVDTVEVPDLTGLTVDDALLALGDAELELGTVSEVPSQEFEAGLVVGSDPTAGSDAPVGSTVDIAVSSGPGTFDLPNYTGRVLSEVRFELQQAGMTVVERSEPSEEVAEGFVVRTDPGPGPIDIGSTVTVFVSEGPAPRAVPNLVGLSQSEAQAELAPLGLVLRVSDSTVESQQYDGLVAEQVPSAGTELIPGQEVTVFIGVAPVLTVLVPDVTGLSEQEAEFELDAVGLAFALSPNTAVTESQELDGLVASQSPAAGVEVTLGQTVTVTLYEFVPPPPTTVPPTTTP